MASAVRVLLPSFGYTYTFTGVLSVKHEYSLKLQTDSSSASGDDYINGARNQPDKVILSVLETEGKMYFGLILERMVEADTAIGPWVTQLMVARTCPNL